MLRQTTRKFAIIATVVFSCVAVAACGNTGSAGNDAIRAKEVAATRAVVTTAAEKTEATTTTTSSAETTTSKSKATTTTTTTTAATTTAEPKTKTTTTTTTAVTTTAEPETSTKLETSTESKAETTESATETIESSATETTESEATTTEEPKEDNPEGMYPLEECFRRSVEEFFKQEVISIDFDENLGTYVATCSEGIKVVFGKSEYALECYNSDKLFKTDDLAISGSTIKGYDFEVSLWTIDNWKYGQKSKEAENFKFSAFFFCFKIIEK